MSHWEKGIKKVVEECTKLVSASQKEEKSSSSGRPYEEHNDEKLTKWR